jgi:hypothetical protein
MSKSYTRLPRYGRGHELPKLALFGHGAMSDFSPLSAQERTWGTDLAEKVPVTEGKH